MWKKGIEHVERTKVSREGETNIGFEIRDRTLRNVVTWL